MPIHKDLENSERHLPKDFEDAGNSTVMSKDENGNLIWVSKNDVGGSQGPQGPQGPAAQIQNVITVQKSPQIGQYSSIAAALAYAATLTPSISNLVMIEVGPGIYVENTLTMIPYVYIKGMNRESVIIEPTLASQDLIIGCHNSGLFNLTLRGSGIGGTDNALVRVGANAVGVPFHIEECMFGDAYKFVWVDTTGGAAYCLVHNCETLKVQNLRYGFGIQGSGTGWIGIQRATVQIYNSENVTSLFFGAGSGNRLGVNQVTVDAVAPAAIENAVMTQDGVKFYVLNSFIGGQVNYGIYINDSGTAPNAVISGVALSALLRDIYVKHPTATGSANGSMDSKKIESLSSLFTSTTFDNANNDIGSQTIGKVLIGSEIGRTLDLTYVIENGMALGLYTGNDILTKGVGTVVNIAPGHRGYMEVPGTPTKFYEVDIQTTSLDVGINKDVYIVVNELGIATTAASIPNSRYQILLGRVVTDSTGILFIENSPNRGFHAANNTMEFVKEALQNIYVSGGIVSEHVGIPFNIDISQGTYWFNQNRFAPVGGSQVSFLQLMRDGVGGWTTTLTQTVNNSYYDDGTGIPHSLTLTYYTKHWLYQVGDGVDETYFLQIGQAEYNTLTAAQSAVAPPRPPYIRDGVVLIAAIIVRQGATSITEIQSHRPTLSYYATGGGGGGVTDHGDLTGLNDPNDHTWAMTLDGSRAMTGVLDMGTHNIINSGTLNGVSITAHAARHLPNGADPLTTASAIEITDSTNSVGTANSLARSDHSHAHGNRGGGSLHTLATQVLNGFMSSTDKVFVDLIKHIIQESIGEPTGFTNRIDSEILFDDLTRTFTIQPKAPATQFEYYIKSVQYIKTTPQSVVIPDVEGIYFFYFDGANLVYDASPPDVALYSDVAVVALLYWDAVNNKAIYFAEERHGIVMDGATHTYLHNIEGTRYDNGLDIGSYVFDGDGSLNTHAQFDISNGMIRDEDLDLTIANGGPQTLSPIAQLPVYFRSGSAGDWRMKAADDYALVYNGVAGYTGPNGRCAYNQYTGATWQLTEIQEGFFGLIHILATNNISQPMIAVVGLNEYSNINNARTSAAAEMLSFIGLPFTEMVPIATIIFKTSSSFTNLPRAAFVSADPNFTFVDFRPQKISTPNIIDHGNLAGLNDDDHQHYLLINGLRAMTGNLNMGGNSLTNLAQIIGGWVSSLGSTDTITFDAKTNLRNKVEGALKLLMTPSIPSTRMLSSYIDANGKHDTMAMFFSYLATSLGVGDIGMVVEANINTANSTGGSVSGLRVSKTGSGLAQVRAIETDPGVKPLKQYNGTFGALEAAFKFDTVFTDILAPLNSAGSNIQIFSTLNEYIYIGHSTPFGALNVELAIAASADITALFEYSKGAGVWTPFGPNDNTSGMTESGVISWEEANLTGWAVDTVNAVTNKYWVRIKRQRVTLATPPTESTFKIVRLTEYGWDENGDVQLRKVNNIVPVEGFLQYSNSALQQYALATFVQVIVDTNRNSFANNLLTKVSSTQFRADFNGVVKVQYSACVYTDTNDRAAEFQLFKNGVAILGTERIATSKNLLDRSNTVSVVWYENVVNGDLIDLRFRSPESAIAYLQPNRVTMSVEAYRRTLP